MEANNVEEYLQSARRKKSTGTLPTASLLDRIRQEDTGNGVPSTPPPPIPPRGPRHSMLLQPDPDSTGMGPGAAVGVDPIVSVIHTYCPDSSLPHTRTALTPPPSHSLSLTV